MGFGIRVVGSLVWKYAWVWVGEALVMFVFDANLSDVRGVNRACIHHIRKGKGMGTLVASFLWDRGRKLSHMFPKVYFDINRLWHVGRSYALRDGLREGNVEYGGDFVMAE